MNIVEAVKAAHERGFSIIARDYPGGYELIRFTNSPFHAERANYPLGATAAPVFHNYSLSLGKITSDAWHVFDMSKPDMLGKFEPVKYNSEIKQLHGFCVGDTVTLIHTGETAYILGFNTDKRQKPFDVAVSFVNEKPDSYICAADIKILVPADMPETCVSRKIDPGFFEPFTSECFRKTVAEAADYELMYALAYLVDKMTHGAKVKRRIQAIEREQARRLESLKAKEVTGNG